jgi:NAD(P)-dependent dehydrogenase (short-subunit alcohol dehydrogenase family)
MQTECKTMAVTGVAQGIGAGVTNAFIERGYNVVANSVNITAYTFAATDRLAVVRGVLGNAKEAIRFSAFAHARADTPAL